MQIMTEVNAITGEIAERDLTPKEMAQWQADQAEWQTAKQERLEAEAKRETALEKLAALGLTRDDLTALGF